MRYEKYKESGVAWLGEIPEHWECVPFKRCIKGTMTYGANEPADIDVPNQPRYIRITDINDDGTLKNERKTLSQDKANPYMLCKGDILFARSGATVGKAFVFREDYKACYAGYLIKAVCNEKVLPFFVLYYTMSSTYITWKNSICIQTTIQNISAERYSALSVPLPPLPEQHSIVDYLDNKTALIDQAIEGKLHQQTLLREAKQVLIAEAVTKGLDKNVDLKKSGISWLGEIPEHWEEKRIGAFFHDDIKLNSDFKYTNAYKFNYGTVVLKNETGNVDEYKDTYIKYSVLKAKDIVINGLNLNYDFVSQRVAYVPSDGIITSAYMVLRPRESVNSKFFSYVFKSMDNMKMFHGMGSGIRLTLSFKDLKDRFLPLPPLPEQQAIVEYIESKTEKIDHMIATLDTQVEQLRAYRQRLIADVVTGQKKVC